MAEDPEFPLDRSHLQSLAHTRAAEDSEAQPWPASEAHAVELHEEAAPRTPRELQLLAQRRLADMQHDLLHYPFAQGATLSGLRDETAVQIWIADRLQLSQGHAYSVERESHLADENAPDIRLLARATDASLSIEIKPTEPYSLPELEAALREQLCDRYLRSRNARHGILLLVHQEPRTLGWRHPETGEFLTFEQVVQRLRSLAIQISGEGPYAPQPEIVVIDVSSVAPTD